MGEEQQRAANDALGNPILNSPYEPPERHFEIGPHGSPAR